jgi:hypothetical protein
MVMSDGRPRRRARICMSALLVTGAAVAGGAALSSASAAAAAVTGPTLTFSNSATESSLGTAYSLALTNLLDVNTVTENPATYDQNGLMSSSTGDFIQAGTAYGQAATDTLSVHESANYNSTYGLFEGPAFFNDGVAGYPAPPVDTADGS